MQILVFLILFLTIPISSGSEISVGYFTVSPHIIKPKVKGGRPTGILVQFIEQEIVKRLEHKVIWKGPYSIKRFVSEATKGTFDVGALVGKTDKFKLDQLFYGDKLLYKGKLSMAIRKDLKIKKVTKSSDLDGLKIGIYDSVSSFDQKILDNKKIKLIKVSGVGWFERSFKMMEIGRQDAVIMPEKYPLLFMLHKKKLTNEYNIVEIPGDTFYFHFSFPKKNNSLKLMKDFNNIYNSMKTNYVDYFYKQLNNNSNNFL